MISPGEFAPGWMPYDDHHPGDPEKRIVILARLGNRAQWEVPAIVETGAPWNIFDPRLTKKAQIFADPDQPERILLIRGRRVHGRLGRGPLTLLATGGVSLPTDGVFFIPDLEEDEPWPFPNFLGYGGLLEWIRFAVDPFHNRFWFGKE